MPLAHPTAHAQWHHRLAALLAWALVGLAQAQAPAPLKAFAATSWGPPFLLPHSAPTPRAQAGLIPDWYAELARALKRPIEVSYFPPNRLVVETGTGQPDLGCFGSAAWDTQDAPRIYADTAAPFLRVEEVLVSRSPTVARLADLRGRRVGVVAGYVYPTLEPAFRDGSVLREDAPTELAMLRKQLLGRSDHAVVRRLTLEHLQQTDPQWRVLQASPWLVSVTDLYCGVRRGGALSLADLEAAQRQLLQDGTLARLLKRYGGSVPAP